MHFKFQVNFAEVYVLKKDKFIIDILVIVGNTMSLGICRFECSTVKPNYFANENVLGQRYILITLYLLL